jgi:hypothetical protein
MLNSLKIKQEMRRCAQKHSNGAESLVESLTAEKSLRFGSRLACCNYMRRSGPFFNSIKCKNLAYGNCYQQLPARHLLHQEDCLFTFDRGLTEYLPFLSFCARANSAFASKRWDPIY